MAYISGTKRTNVYTPGHLLGSGGEGAVYEIVGSSDKVLKIYHATHFKTEVERSTMERKLRAMLNMNVAAVVENKLRLAWPTDIVYENGKMVGFVMPKVTAPLKIFDLYREIVPKTSLTKKRDTVHPGYHWKYSVQYAYNLAWVVNYVHSKGIVIGDLNQNNIVADPNSGAVILIDCDSFDIRDPISKEHFRCTYALPEILAPELQTVGTLANGNFTRESDNFSLAIHIFRLLMNNADPFGGQITTNASQSAIAANTSIINGECPYVRAVPGKTLHPRMLPLSFLPSSLQTLFRRTFDYTAITAKSRINDRARASEWMEALLLIGQKNPTTPLVTCPKDMSHVYPSHNVSCPWCKVLVAMKQPVRPVPPPSPSPHPIPPSPQPRPVPPPPPRSVPPSPKHKGKYGCFVALLLLLFVVFALYLFRDNLAPIYDPVQDFISSVFQTEPTVPDTGYILPNSNTEYLTEADLTGLTDQELVLAKNEIFARHGRKFDTKEIRDYFLKTSWYEELYEPEFFDQNVYSFFNEYEWANLHLIRAYRGEDVS